VEREDEKKIRLLNENEIKRQHGIKSSPDI
jgi:hypothetical protein